jgi:hypothetical protein
VNILAHSFIRAILIGLGATLSFDLWALLLKHAFKVTPSNICLVGRWIRRMPKGAFSHTNIASSPPKRGECSIGWIARYLIGATFAIAFVGLVGSRWLWQPTPVATLAFVVVTVLAPFCIMEPLMGHGFAASKTPNPTLARLRSLMDHFAVSAGLYLFAWLVNRL